jgi:threonylcarbamoyladenosine tRNA methylthiotransferase MtaB
MEKFLIKTMGCKSNQLEGALIEENLTQNGFTKVENIIDADVFILNSCTVTHKSDNEAFSIIKKVKQQNKNIKIILTGCIAQIEKEKLLQNPIIDIILGNNEKLDILKYLNNNYSVGNIENLNSFNKVLLKNTRKTRASLKIQDGCNNRCSYCIIPFARGSNRSADLEFVLKQIKIYEKSGFKEIVLTGIHIGQWGMDFQMENNLLFLLKNIEEKTKINRFRLGSLNPLEINDEMLNFLKSSSKFCPHFHLSLQSMCDKTLKAMNRNYSVSQTLELIDKINQTFYLPFIGSDIIAGFAGENEKDFDLTVENLEQADLTQIHTFPYSIREGTLAAKFPNQLPQKLKDDRAKIIKKISAQKYSDFLQKNLGTTQEVLIEKNIDKKTKMFKGISRNYLNIFIEPKENFSQIQNTVQNVSIININPILGKILK